MCRGCDPFPYPRRLVAAVFDDVAAERRVPEALERAGFASHRFVVLRGEKDARRLDVEGDEHELTGRHIRALRAVSSPISKHARRYAEHLRSARLVVGDDDDAKQRAVDALHAAGGRFINYYADNNVESSDDR